ncbi:neuropeptide Y receptor type 1-like [Glandiceps talaboti]
MKYSTETTNSDAYVFDIDDKEYFECICFPEDCDYSFDYPDFNVTENFNASDYDLDFNCKRGELTDAAKIVLITVYTSTILLTLIGNAIVILVLTLGARTKTTLNKYLINLAVADMALAIFAMPFSFVYALMKDWIFSEFMCPVVLFMQQVST